MRSLSTTMQLTFFIALALILSSCLPEKIEVILGLPTEESKVILSIEEMAFVTMEDTALEAKFSLTKPKDKPLIYTITRIPKKGTVTITNEYLNEFRYEPFPNVFGKDDFELSVSDEENGAIGNVHVYIQPVNDAPIAVDGNLHVTEGTPGSGKMNALDEENDNLIYSVVQNPGKGTFTQFDSGTGAYTYTPSAGELGNDLFTFKVFDGNNDSNIATIHISLNEPNHAPVASNESFVIPEDNLLSDAVSASDADGDKLTYIKVRDPSHGILSFSSTGSFIYKPNSNYSGSDSFTFKVHDGMDYSNVATASITVQTVSDSPVAHNDVFDTDEDNLLDNTLRATDPDSTDLTYSLVSNGNLGTATITNAATGAFSYIPHENISGMDTISFKANDGSNDSNVASVAIAIKPVNDTPVAQNSALSVDHNTPKDGQLSASDIENDDLTFVIVDNPTKGQIAGFNSLTGAYQYIPNDNESGEDSFSFKVNDGTLDSNIALVTIDISSHFVWSAPASIAGVPSSSHGPRLAVSKNGTAIAVWLKGIFVRFGYNYELWASHYDKETGWDTPSMIAYRPSVLNLNIKMDDSGNALILWAEYGVGGGNVYIHHHAKYYNKNSGWETQMDLQAGDYAPTFSSTSNQMDFDAEGNAYVVFKNNNNNQLMSAKRSKITGQWTKPVFIGSSPHRQSSFSLAVSQTGYVTVLFTTARDNNGHDWDIYEVTSTNGTSWSSQRMFIPSAYSPYLTINSKGNMVAMYKKKNSTLVMAKIFKNGIGWISETGFANRCGNAYYPKAILHDNDDIIAYWVSKKF